MNIPRAAVLLVIASTTSAWAVETNFWLGANTASGTTTQTDVDNAAYWSLSRVPGVGNDDVAQFRYDGFNEAEMYVSASHAFAPSAVMFNACYGSTDYNADFDIYLDKALTLDRLICTSYGGSTGGSGVLFQERLRIGTVSASPLTITLTGNGDALDLTAKNATWQFLRFGTKTTMDFTGSDVSFSRAQQRYGFVDLIVGGTQVENASNTGNSTLRFSTSGASVYLEDQGVHGASIGAGYLNVAARSDQTWTADPTAFIRFRSRVGATGLAGPDLIQSIDGGRLDNLGQLNIIVGRSDNTAATKTTGQRIVGGTYGSLSLSGGNTSRRDIYFVQRGDVTLARTAVDPASSSTAPAATNVYSLILSTGSSNYQSNWILDTDGYDLAMVGALRLHEGSDTTANPVSVARLDALAATVTIGGDVLIHSTNHSPWAPTNGFSVARTTGIRGDATSVFRLKGNYRNECRSYSGTSFHLSTFELVGGANVRTFEVGDAKTLTGVQGSSFSVATFNVGDGTVVGNVQLVNNVLNDNPIVSSNATDIVGEKLIAGVLNVNAGSTLDVNAQVAEVGTALTVAGDATLDLNTGLTLEDAQVLKHFYGRDDQTTAWTVCAGRVVDSDNPKATFAAVYDAGDDRTYWMVASLGNNATVLTVR